MASPASSANAAAKPKVVAIWARQLDGQPMAGRLKIAHAIRDVLSKRAQLTNITLSPTGDGPMKARRLLRIGFAWGASLFTRLPLPLQSAMFADSKGLAEAVAAIPDDIDTIYIDGVRLFPLLRKLRAARPNARIVVDFDDLLSRRHALLMRRGETISPGYVGARLPRIAQRIIASRLWGRLLLRYEHTALRRIELDTLRLADAVVLLSVEDTAELRRAAAERKGANASILNIRPAVALNSAQPVVKPLHFIFIGSDRLTQNRLTIDYLIDRWKRWGVQAPLTIYGQHTRKPELPPTVSMPGYAESLADVYSPSSVLITPSFLGGGVKTKVLEAFAYGRPVIANDVTFEGLSLLESYPLNINTDEALQALLSNPDAHLELFKKAARLGRTYVEKEHGEAQFESAWIEAILPGGND